MGSQETRQLGVHSAGDGVGGIEVKNPRNEATCLSPRVNKEGLEDFGQVAVATMSSNWWNGVVRGNKSLGLPGGDDTLLHGIVGDMNWLGLRRKGNLKLVDGQEDSPEVSEMM